MSALLRPPDAHADAAAKSEANGSRAEPQEDQIQFHEAPSLGEVGSVEQLGVGGCEHAGADLALVAPSIKSARDQHADISQHLHEQNEGVAVRKECVFEVQVKAAQHRLSDAAKRQNEADEEPLCESLGHVFLDVGLLEGGCEVVLTVRPAGSVVRVLKRILIEEVSEEQIHQQEGRENKVAVAAFLTSDLVFFLFFEHVDFLVSLHHSN